MKKIGFIYEIRNKVNDKVYIGSTTNISRRFKEHKKALKSGNHHSKYLQNSHNKHGIDSFEFNQIIRINYVKKSELFELEKFYMNKYKSFNSDFGYNMAEVSIDGGFEFSEEQKMQLSLDSKQSKPIFMINSEGRIVAEFHSISYAARELNTVIFRIQESINVHGKRCRKHMFIYKSDYDKDRDYSFKLYNINSKRNGKKIIKFSIDGKYIKTYNKVEDAAIDNNTKPATISDALRGRNYTSMNYIWKRLNDFKEVDLSEEQLKAHFTKLNH